MAKLDRRTFLRGAGGVLVGLPFLNAMGCGRSERDPRGTRQFSAGGFPKRLVVFFSGNGTIAERWGATGSEHDFALNELLAPLDAHKQDLVVLSGIDNTVARSGPGDGHQRGMGSMLSGVQVLAGDEFIGGNPGFPTPSGWGGGISVDQVIAGHIGATTRFRSLELGVQNGPGEIWSRMSYLAPEQPVPVDDDPFSVWDRVFGDLGVDRGQQIAQRHLVLDAVLEDYRRLEARLGGEDRARLDRHLTSIADVASRLDNGAVDTPECEQPGLGASFDVHANANFPLVGRLQMDLLATALACDLTRVGSLLWNRSHGDAVFSWLDPAVTQGHHALTHEGLSNEAAWNDVARINTWYAGQLAYFLDLLESIPEGDGTLLDNTLVLCCNEVGNGNTHSRNNLPWLLAGRAGGALETGRYLLYGGTESHCNLLVSLLHAFGVDADSFGDPDHCTGPVAGLL